MGWTEVAAALPEAKAIAWEGCHKIYVLMDDEQVAETRACGYGDGYGELIEASDFEDVADMLATLRKWFREGERDCGLQFISAVRTNHEDPNAGFTDLIEQGEEDL